MSTYITKLAKELGLKVIDAKESIEIIIKPSDITNSVSKNSKDCAFSRACKRQVPDIRKAYFFRSIAWLEYDDRLVRYLLPSSVQKEIVSFDRSKKMDPGTYQISAPNPSSTFKEIKKRSNKRPGRHKPSNTGIKRKIKHMTTSIRSLLEPK